MEFQITGKATEFFFEEKTNNLAAADYLFKYNHDLHALFWKSTTPFSFRKKITLYSFINIKNWFGINGSKSHTFKVLHTNECFIKSLLYIKLVSRSHSMRGICAAKHNWGASPRGKLTTYNYRKKIFISSF